MKVALVGPIVKDKITVDRVTSVQVGGIPYYEGVALKNLGTDVTVFGTYAFSDDTWVRKNFKNIEVVHIPAERTIEFERVYSSMNPDACISVEARYAKNRIDPMAELIGRLNSFDYVIFGPLFYDNISPLVFASVPKEKSVLGNFGMFNYPQAEGSEWRNPENLVHVMPHLSYVFLDDREVRFAAKKKTVNEAVHFLQSKTDAVIIVTFGSKGSTIFSGGKRYSVPAFTPEKISDPTGAGDTYAAAFIRAINVYNDPVSVGSFAAMVATMKIERYGAFAGNMQDVLARLAAAGVLLK